MSHASEPSMAALWVLLLIGGFGGLALLWAFGGLWLEVYREEAGCST